jgi:hypothetical protein
MLHPPLPSLLFHALGITYFSQTQGFLTSILEIRQPGGLFFASTLMIFAVVNPSPNQTMAAIARPIRGFMLI